jgi:hypothetical protein
MTNEQDMLKKYRALKERTLDASDAVDQREQKLLKIDAIRDEVYKELLDGGRPGAQKLFVAVYGQELALAALKEKNAEWQDISRQLGEMLAQIRNGADGH